jgi:hypothetical protein
MMIIVEQEHIVKRGQANLAPARENPSQRTGKQAPLPLSGTNEYNYENKER